MRSADSYMQRRTAEQALPECGRASRVPAPRRKGGMPGAEVSVAMPESGARKYLDAIPRTKNRMREALLHERAAKCLLKDGELEESLRHAHEAHTIFKGIDTRAAERFKDRFTAWLSSASRGAVSVEFFEL